MVNEENDLLVEENDTIDIDTSNENEDISNYTSMRKKEIMESFYKIPINHKTNVQNFLGKRIHKIKKEKIKL